MAAREPVEPGTAPRTAHEDLAYIRRTLDAAGHLSTIPGRGLAMIGAMALAAALVSLRWTGAPWTPGARIGPSLAVWGALLGLSLAVGGWTMARKAHRSGQVFWSPVLRKALWGYGGAMLLGGVLTLGAVRGGRLDILPEIWLGCYGVALCSAGAMSVSPVRWMGVCFLLLAAAAALLPAGYGLALVGAGFGWLHIAFGAYIAWRHHG